MHASSYAHMTRLADSYAESLDPGVVYDVGSQSINGSYRIIFESRGWTYQGLDVEAGPNVDIVLDDPYTIPLADGSATLFISGQAFEHIEFFWLTFAEMARALAPGGLIFLIAPSRGPEHRFPVDCWRFYRDGFTALGRWGQLQTLEATTDWAKRRWYRRSNPLEMWGDTVGVFQKPVQPS